MVTSSGYCYPHQNQKIAYETALAIKDGKKNYEPDARKIKGDHHIFSEQEVRDILKKNDFHDIMIDNLIDGTNALADRCHIKITL
jgi:DNA polymerase III alpha subunit